MARDRPRVRDDRASSSVELLGMIPWLLLAALAALQMLLVGFAVTAAENAARTAGRAVTVGGDPAAAALAGLPAALRPAATVELRDAGATVRLQVPAVLPGVDRTALTVARSAEFPAADPREGDHAWD